MIDENRFRDILRRLLDRSKSDKVHWLKGAKRGGEQYCVVFSEYAEIHVIYYSQNESPDSAQATLNISGRVVASLSAEEDDSEDWALLKALHYDAQRTIYGFDRALETIEKALSSDDVAGLSVDEFESPPVEPPAGDDIPF